MPQKKKKPASVLPAAIEASLPSGKDEGCILVCVTRQRTCERLILRGAELAREESLSLCVLNVTPSGQPFLGSTAEGAALDYLYQVASDNGGEAVMLKSDNVAHTLADYARRRNAKYLVMGETPGKAGRGFSFEMQALLPDVRILTL